MKLLMIFAGAGLSMDAVSDVLHWDADRDPFGSNYVESLVDPITSVKVVSMQLVAVG